MPAQKIQNVLILLSFLLFTTAGFAHEARIADAGARIISIPPGDLLTALDTLARQADVELVYRPEQLKGLKTNGISGTLSSREAIEKLLEGTPLKLSVDENTGAMMIGQTRPRATAITSLSPEGRGSANGADQTDGNAATGSSRGTGSESSSGAQEVIVTGTNIRGIKDLAVPSIIYTREDIEKAGYTTVEEIFEDLPQNFDGFTLDGGIGEGIGQLASANRDGATAVDLRGLGPQSTLVLVNGQRRAGGLNGRVVDVSGIPVSAVERVEIVTGGRSAIYGSDAVGGVVNFVLRRSFDGAESQVGYGARDGGGGRSLQASQIFGRRLERGGFLATYDYTDESDLDLFDTGLVVSPAFDGTVPYARSLRPDRKRHAGMLAAELDVSERVQLHADGMYSRIKTESRQVLFTPPNSRLTDATSLVDTVQYSGSVGASVELGAQWGLEVSGALSFSEGDFTSDSLRNGVRQPLFKEIAEATISSITAVADGRLPAMGRVVPRMAIGAEARDEDIDSSVPNEANDRTVGSVFAELVFPLVEGGTRAGLRRLELSLAGRYDDYSDFGSSFDPQVGLIWEPAAGVKLRGAYSTAFRAPDLYTTLPRSTSVALINRPDSTAPGGQRPVFQVGSTTNPQLGPEEAEGWSAGVDYQPDFAPQLQLSVSYFDIDYQDRIISPLVGADLMLVLERGNLFASLIDRAPTEAQLRALAATDGSGIDNLTGVSFNPATQNYLTVFPGLVYVNGRINNIARDSVRGVDLSVDTRRPTGMGDLSFGVNGTYTLQHERNVTPTSPAFSLINEVGKPVDLRLRASAGLARGAWGGFVFVNYVRGYDNPLSTPASTLPSWTTVDLTVRYKGSDLRGGWLQGLSAALTLDNVFDSDPPDFLQNDRGLRYDTTNADPVGRYLSLRITRRW